MCIINAVTTAATATTTATATADTDAAELLLTI